MPIYAYKCESCGHTKDVLQKMSDATLTDCPQCGASTFKKQLTAAGFQLKGSGWYVTDFRGDASAKATAADGQGAESASKSGEAAAPGGAVAAPAASGAITPAASSAAATAPPTASGAAPAATKNSTSSKAKGDT